MPGGHSKGLARRILLYGRRVRQAKLVGGLAGFFEQLDISHGSPRDERSPGVVFFGAFFFDCFYGDSTGVVVDQPSVEAAPAPEPHGYSLSVPLLRQIPGHECASPVRLRSPGILPFGPAPALVCGPSSAAKLVTIGVFALVPRRRRLGGSFGFYLVPSVPALVVQLPKE